MVLQRNVQEPKFDLSRVNVRVSLCMNKVYTSLVLKYKVQHPQDPVVDKRSILFLVEADLGEIS